MVTFLISEQQRYTRFVSIHIGNPSGTSETKRIKNRAVVVVVLRSTRSKRPRVRTFIGARDERGRGVFGLPLDIWTRTRAENRLNRNELFAYCFRPRRLTCRTCEQRSAAAQEHSYGRGGPHGDAVGGYARFASYLQIVRRRAGSIAKSGKRTSKHHRARVIRRTLIVNAYVQMREVRATD